MNEQPPLGPGDRVMLRGESGNGPGTVVSVSLYPANIMLMRPVIWDDNPHEVYFLPAELLVPYKTEREQLEEMAVSLGFPPRPEGAGYREKAEWEASFNKWAATVKKLAKEDD